MKKYILIHLLLVISVGMKAQTNIQVIGHRGAMGYETENTLASIQKALELGVDAIEVDVYKIKSGELVVFHDDTLDRLTEVKGNIEDFEWSQLQKITLTGEHAIPTLQQVLNVIDKKCRLNIELKGADTAVKTFQVVQEYMQQEGWKQSDFIISSFKWDELEQMRALDATIPIAVLTSKDPLQAIPMAQKLNAEAINPTFRKLNQENVKAMHTAGFKVYVWTVNTSKDIQQMIDFSVDGIITNFPDRVTAAVKSN